VYEQTSKAFTMIELIFVILVIGVLAGFAMSTLSATRDDAKVSNIVSNTRIALNDIKTTYTSQGQETFNTLTVASVTAVPFTTTCGTLVPVSTLIAGATLRLCAGTHECIRFDVNASGISVDITATTPSSICEKVQSMKAIKGIAGATSGVAKNHTLGGSAR